MSEEERVQSNVDVEKRRQAQATVEVLRCREVFDDEASKGTDDRIFGNPGGR